MANSQNAGVIYVDANGATSFSHPMTISGIKYIGESSGTAAITERVSTDPLWEEDGTANVYDQVSIHASQGITVTLSNSAVVYIYLDR